MLNDLFNQEELSALFLSLKVGFFCVFISLPPGIWLAWVLARKNFPGKSFVDNLIYLPLVLPPVSIGYLVLILMGKKGFIGSFLYNTFGLQLAFNWKGAVLISSIMGFPLMVRSIRSSFESIDRRLENVSHTLGVSRVKTFLGISLPLAFPGIINGMVLTFTRSLGEFGATITFISNMPYETQTIPMLIYNYSQIPDGDRQALKFILLSILLSMSALLISEIIYKKHQKKVGWSIDKH